MFQPTPVQGWSELLLALPEFTLTDALHLLKLHEHLVASRVIAADVSCQWVRRLLRARCISFQHTKTWAESPVADFEPRRTGSWTSTTIHPPTGG